jgi:hypothetical protein
MMPGHKTVVAARFNGPPTSGNGGYTCGILASLIGDTAEVTLRKPPTLDKEMVVRTSARGLALFDGETIVADGRPGELDIEIPLPPTDEQIIEAEAGFMEGRAGYGFTTCFVCGPDRDHGDGMRIFPARIEEQELVGGHWTPSADLADDDGVVDTRVVWAALDCPTFFGASLRGSPRQSVLGRMTATIKKPIRAGQTYTVTGWPIDQNGRRVIGGSAVFDADGELCAASKGMWFELPDD